MTGNTKAGKVGNKLGDKRVLHLEECTDKLGCTDKNFKNARSFPYAVFEMKQGF